VLRIDRDTMRRKDAMQTVIDEVHTGKPCILVGTQMLAKGHDFPRVTLVGIVDVDQGLFSADFRGAERMAQLLIQVAGRAGRAEQKGLVLIQTHHPDHPLLQTLIVDGYDSFADATLRERKEAGLPPYAHMALLRAEATSRELPLEFLLQAKRLAQADYPGAVALLGPVPAPMEKRAGRFRAQLLLQASERADLQNLLTRWLPALENHKAGRKVRWSIDVDPLEMF
jgi:primosomal protein N' (replication factor Y)